MSGDRTAMLANYLKSFSCEHSTNDLDVSYKDNWSVVS